MAALYLHVGHGKTGSSYIQSSLALSRQALLDKGIDYPEANSSENARLGKITSGNGGMLRHIISSNYSSGAEKVLLSSEVLFHDIVDGKLDSLLESLVGSHFESVNILVFIRDLVEHASSSYQQMVKRGGSTASVEDVFSRYKQPELVADFIDRCQKLPGFKITIRNYSNCRKNLLDEVESWVEAPKGILEKPSVENVNRSMTRSELRLQKGVNQYLGKSGHLVSDRLCNNLPEIESEKALPSEEDQKAMLRRLEKACDYVGRHASSEHRYNNVTIPVSDDSLREDNYVFTGKQIDTIASGLAGEISRLKYSSSPKKHASPDSDNIGKVATPDFFKKVGARFERYPADALRDMALCFESAGDLNTAYYLMSLALRARPKGKMINKKVSDYASLLG
ncbi:hypothetical protein [Halomonas elongata]|uniref:hypothetical protein n=1 Tax=Halomonas elongata TaxID=2746 RepID=UPI00186B96B5|nr:hypothetical protein [Halomonas elongata]MBW5799002.1 hypothetical protein [Halomonas elongata]